MKIFRLRSVVTVGHQPVAYVVHNGFVCNKLRLVSLITQRHVFMPGSRSDMNAVRIANFQQLSFGRISSKNSNSVLL